MNYKEKDKVMIRSGRIATIDKVIYEMVDGKGTDNIYCYEATINGVGGYIVYPDDIEE